MERSLIIMKITTMLATLALGLSGFAIGGQVAGGPPIEDPQGDGPRVFRKSIQRSQPPLMKALDANHDGAIDAAEIANAAKAFLKLDKNGDGKLTQDEFRQPTPSQLSLALDANRDGVIDAGEIANASAALKALDKNGDGRLTPEELRPIRPQDGGPSSGQTKPPATSPSGQ
jgi:Ca2+-binding EF-hand superfamily protein